MVLIPGNTRGWGGGGNRGEREQWDVHPFFPLAILVTTLFQPVKKIVLSLAKIYFFRYFIIPPKGHYSLIIPRTKRS